MAESICLTRCSSQQNTSYETRSSRNRSSITTFACGILFVLGAVFLTLASYQVLPKAVNVISYSGNYGLVAAGVAGGIGLLLLVASLKSCKKSRQLTRELSQIELKDVFPPKASGSETRGAQKVIKEPPKGRNSSDSTPRSSGSSIPQTDSSSTPEERDVENPENIASNLNQKMEEQKKNEAATDIQRVYRGYLGRKQAKALFTINSRKAPEKENQNVNTSTISSPVNTDVENHNPQISQEVSEVSYDQVLNQFDNLKMQMAIQRMKTMIESILIEDEEASKEDVEKAKQEKAVFLADETKIKKQYIDSFAFFREKCKEAFESTTAEKLTKGIPSFEKRDFGYLDLKITLSYESDTTKAMKNFGNKAFTNPDRNISILGFCTTEPDLEKHLNSVKEEVQKRLEAHFEKDSRLPMKIEILFETRYSEKMSDQHMCSHRHHIGWWGERASDLNTAGKG